MRIFCVLILISSLISCGTQKAVIGDNFSVTMDKGSCFGSCPVYSLNINKTGYAMFEGERFTDKIGKHGLQLQTNKFNAIAKAFADADLPSFNDNYPSDIADLPSTTIAYVNNAITKRITGKKERPQKVLDLQSMLEDITQMEGWISLDTTATEAIVEKPKDEDLIKNEIIIKFSPGTFISRWMKQFKDYSMYVKKPLTDDKMTWLTHFNIKKVDPDTFLDQIKKDPAVMEAEFNKKVEKRD